jgi:hypothetical protein
MKTYSKRKSASYREVVIQDESGLDFIKVSRRMFASFSGMHAVKASTHRVPARVL